MESFTLMKYIVWKLVAFLMEIMEIQLKSWRGNSIVWGRVTTVFKTRSNFHRDERVHMCVICKLNPLQAMVLWYVIKMYVCMCVCVRKAATGCVCVCVNECVHNVVLKVDSRIVNKAHWYQHVIFSTTCIVLKR